MRTQQLWIAAAVVAALALVIVVGLSARDGGVAVASPTPSLRATPSASATAATSASASAPTAASAGPTGGAGNSAVYNDDFGFIVTDVGTGARVRTESGAPVQGLSFDQQGFAVSPDGKLVAYWSVGTSSQPSQLRMFTTQGNATQQTLITLPAGTRGGGIAWSSDGAGLLYSTETGTFGIGGGTNSATLNIYELSPGGPHGTVIDTQTNTGFLYRPIAWDRSVNLAAAGLTGEGGFLGTYVTVRINANGSFTAQRSNTASQDIAMGTVRASTDAKLVLGVDGTGKVRWWPVADVGAIKTAAGTGTAGARWQPGTHKIGFLSADNGFVLFNADDGSAATPLTGIRAGSVLRTFRADGSAVVFAVIPPGSSGLGSTDYALTRLADRASVTFQATGGLGPSVRLR
jgi:hypothetical protein